MAWLGYAFITFVVAVLSQAIVTRVGLLGNAFNSFMAVGGCLGVALMVQMFRYHTIDIAVAATLTYGLLCELFIFTFTFVGSTVSANLLIRISRRPMNRDEIDGLYDDREMIKQRIEGLINARLLAEQNGSLSVTARGAAITKGFYAAQRLFSHM